MFKCTKYKEPPYAERHVRWCERSENKGNRRKTPKILCFPPTRLAWRVLPGGAFRVPDSPPLRARCPRFPAFPATVSLNRGQLSYALPSNRPSVSLFVEVRTAAPPQSALPGPSRAHSSFRCPTHFRQIGLLWHFSWKCVTPRRPEVPLQGTFLLPPSYALPPNRPSAALFVEVRDAAPPRSALIGSLGASERT